MKIVELPSELQLWRGYQKMHLLLWANPRRRSVVVLLQDRAQHIGEAVDGCQKSLTTMYSIMLPRNPLPGSFTQLLDVFRSSQ
jgi:hypothetical protein